jgi:hypothetical protein
MSQAVPNLPPLPAPHGQLVKHLAEHPDTPMQELLAPYRQYEAELRSVFAQDRSNPVLDDPHINVLPLFTADTKHITTRARDLAAESQEEKDRYMMPRQSRVVYDPPTPHSFVFLLSFYFSQLFL